LLRFQRKKKKKKGEKNRILSIFEKVYEERKEKKVIEKEILRLSDHRYPRVCNSEETSDFPKGEAKRKKAGKSQGGKKRPSCPEKKSRSAFKKKQNKQKKIN
jgi:hypothetical protein